MLISFTVEKYRSFLAPTTVHLGRKLTLLFGYNNVGKSALLRALVLLAASCREGRDGPVLAPLALHDSAAREQPFAGLVCSAAPAPELRFALEWTDQRVEWRIREVLSTSESVGVPMVLDFSCATPALNLRWIPNDERSPEYEKQGDPSTFRTLHFDRIVPLDADLGELRGRLRALAKQVVRLGATRPPPQHRYDPAKGDHLQHAAAEPARFLHHEGPNSAVVLETQRALQNITGVLFETREDVHGVHIDFQDPGRLQKLVPFPVVGEGIVHVLPVVTAACAAARGDYGEAPLVVMQQPELHLHPRAEKSLLDELVLAADGAGKPRFVLETHSENMLLAVQLAVAEGRLLPSDVSIVWVSRPEGGWSTTRSIEVKPNGLLGGWPSGVFSEDVALARRVLDAAERRTSS